MFPLTRTQLRPVHYMATFACRKTPGPILEALNEGKNFSMADTYAITKVLDVYLAREMSLLPRASGVVVNSVNPGLTLTDLRRDVPWIIAL